MYEVDFAIKVNGNFHTIHTAFIAAVSLSECHHIAESMIEDIPASKNNNVSVFVEADIDQ